MLCLSRYTCSGPLGMVDTRSCEHQGTGGWGLLGELPAVGAALCLWGGWTHTTHNYKILDFLMA